MYPPPIILSPLLDLALRFLILDLTQWLESFHAVIPSWKIIKRTVYLLVVVDVVLRSLLLAANGISYAGTSLVILELATFMAILVLDRMVASLIGVDAVGATAATDVLLGGPTLVIDIGP